MKLYLNYFDIQLRSAMQYKLSFLGTLIGHFFVSFEALIGISFLFARFSGVKGYTYPEVLLCFSITLMAFSLAEIFARGFDTFSGIVKKGEFDRIMVRPRSPVLQVLGSRMDFTRLGRVAQAVAMLWYAVAKSGVVWTWEKRAGLFLMIVCGTALFFGLFLVYAGLCFFTIEGLEFMNVLTDGAREYGKYPVAVYGDRVLRFCTYIVPFALFQYYPFLYLIGRTRNRAVLLLPLLAACFCLPCYAFWRFGVRHYKSCG